MVGALQRTIAAGDDDAAHKIFEVFEDLMVLELPFLQKHFADFVNLCAAIAKDTNQSDEVRSMALSFIMTSTHYARSKIQKQGLIPVILEAALPVAAEEEPADRDEQYPAKTALQLVNSLAVIFPPQHVFPLVMRNAVVFLQSADANYRRAAMLSIAVLVEGCADHMRERISEIFPLIVHAMQDAAPSVRRSACTALGALAEDLDDEVTVQHAVLLPLLLSMCDDPDPDVQPVAITTIDSIVESLDDEVAPYTDTLIQKLVGLLASPNRKTVLSATNCIGTLARSAGSAFGPYFEGVMARLYALMSLSETSDLDLRAVATDAVAAVAEAMGKEAFAPYTQRVMEVAIQGIHIDNSQLREYSYSFFGTLARVFGEDFSPFLSLIVPQIMFSCKLQDKDWNSLLDTTTPDEVDLDDEDDDEDDDANKFSFNSAISHEKASSFSALGELFAATRSAFMPYVADVLNAANGATQHFNEEVRISAAQCLLRFFTTVFSMAHPGEWTPGLPLAVPAHENVVSVAQLALGGVITMLEEEDSRMVMARLLQELTETIKQVGPAAVAFEFTDSPHESPRHLDALTGLLQLLFTGEHGCQISEDFDPSAGQGDEELAELDALVISTAADVLGALAAALGPNFPHVFAPFLPLIAKHYQKSRPVSDRSMAVGSLAEIVDGLESGISQFTGDLLQLFMRALRDDEEEVRSNAVFGLGVLIQYSTVDLTSYYPQLLQLLHPFFKSTAKSNLADNACGTVARMILRAPGAVPLDQVLPVFVEALPLKRDFVENESVIKCLLGLLDAQNAAAVALLPRIVHVFGQMLAPPAAQLRDADRSSLVGFMNSMRTHRAAEFEAIVAAMPADARDAVVRALTQ
nr:hypothetical protein HK105_006877 [Polyrhizophydium stewartii]